MFQKYIHLLALLLSSNKIALSLILLKNMKMDLMNLLYNKGLRLIKIIFVKITNLVFGIQ